MHINLLLIHSIDEKIFLPTDFKGFFCALHFLPDFHLSSSSPSLSKPDFCCCEIRSVDFFANWSATLWTSLQIYGQLLSFLRLPAAIHPLICDVPSVFELHEVGLRVILSAKKNLCHLIMITNATFACAFVSSQTDTRVAAIQDLGTRLGRWRAIAWQRLLQLW